MNHTNIEVAVNLQSLKLFMVIHTGASLHAQEVLFDSIIRSGDTIEENQSPFPA